MKFGRPMAARAAAIAAAAAVALATPTSVQAATGEDPYFRWDSGVCGNSIVISAKTSSGVVEWSTNGTVQASHGAYWFPSENFGYPDAGDAVRLGYSGGTFEFVTYGLNNNDDVVWGPSFQNIPIVACAGPFNDVAVSHAFANNIVWLYNTGITTGYQNGDGTVSFRGSQPVLREQMAAFLYRFDHEGGNPPNDAPNATFPDAATNTFTKHIAWLAEQGITTGYVENGVTTFRGSQSVLREQMAAFLYRLAGKPPVDLPATSPFADVPTSHTFYKEIVWLASQNITTGYVENGVKTFRGSQPVLREQMAAFLNRYQDNVVSVS
ncbi:S-layer homology domain-containing protein [Aeromicrobium alkaliterrae]|uniref:SLH domain-containing protein n=1 Tax=Aeromicrobium alkaliterrae TaxID=302168 RepID=A0ABP4VUY8_9ACTN